MITDHIDSSFHFGCLTFYIYLGKIFLSLITTFHRCPCMMMMT
uniref:Uncharacterized protein n=1 Tax=Rhizophora mucronata TaxID=61149 RepID=A0A2P2PXR7_RHIMU